MAYLRILTGPRANDLVELNPAATLTVGSAAEAHIQLEDAAVAPIHCQVYPAQGSFWLQDLGQGATFLNMGQLANATHGLALHDVIVLGRTYLELVAEPPAEPAAPSDPHELETVQQQLAGREDELEALRSELEARRAELEEATQKATWAEEAAEQLRQDVEQSALTIGRLKEELRELEEARARSESERLDAKRTHLESKTAEAVAQRELAQAREGLAALEEELTRARAELEEARAEIARAGAEGEGRAREVGRELAFVLSVLEASREALASLGVQRPASDLPRGDPEDPGTLLDAAGVDPELRARLESSLAAYVDRESLRRFSGTALAFERAESSRALRGELEALRARAADLAVGLAADRPGAA